MVRVEVMLPERMMRWLDERRRVTRASRGDLVRTLIAAEQRRELELELERERP